MYFLLDRRAAFLSCTYTGHMCSAWRELDLGQWKQSVLKDFLCWHSGPLGPASRERTRVTGLNVIEARVGCGQAAIDAGRSKLGNISGLRKAMISSISLLRSVRTCRQSGMKAPACSTQR
jgi:hypothetical protein